jgi:hypothetical protein
MEEAYVTGLEPTLQKYHLNTDNSTTCIQSKKEDLLKLVASLIVEIVLKDGSPNRE